MEFHTGNEQEVTVNIIAEHILLQVNPEGQRELLLEEIIDFRRDEQVALKQSEAFEQRQHNGHQVCKKTTIEWQLLVQWKDGSTNWVELKDMKQSYPVQSAEFSVQARIDKEPAFA